MFNGSIVPGNHTISVTMVFRGHGYGIFTYLKGYRFTVRSSHTFTAAEGRQNVITVRAFEKGNVTTELKDRPAIKFEISLYNVRSKGGEQMKTAQQGSRALLRARGRWAGARAELEVFAHRGRATSSSRSAEPAACRFRPQRARP